MIRWFLCSVITTISLLSLSLAACPKPASPDQRSTSARPGGGSPPAAVSYKIQFERPLKPGLRYKVTASGNTDTVITLNGKVMPAESKSMVYDCEAVVTVLAVHTNGKPIRERLVIRRLLLTKSGGTADLLPAGTVVLAQAKGDKEIFTVEGKPVSADTAEVLGDVLSLYDGDSTNDDDVFGPGGLKKPGDTWKMNVERMLASLKRIFKNPALWPKVSDVTSKVTFVGLKKVAGLKGLLIKAEARIKNFAPNMGPVKATSGRFALMVEGVLPMDPTIAVTGTANVTMRMHVDSVFTKGGQVYRMTVATLHSIRRTRTLLQ